jgi:peroxiredoxin
MFTRSKTEPVPEVGAEAPEFNLPSAQGGQLRLSMRTVRGPVVVASYRSGDAEDVEYFKELAAKEDEINLAAGSVVAIGIAEPNQALNFARASGLKSYVLYDYAKITSRQWGLLEKDRKQGDYARRAVFVVGPDRKVAHAWVGERPGPAEVLAKVSEISGLPKPPEEPKPDESEGESEGGDEKPKRMSAEEREKIKAERRAAREAGKSVETGTSEEGGDEGKPKKMSAEERQRIKAERRAAREAGKSLKKPGSAGSTEAESDGKEEETKKEG